MSVQISMIETNDKYKEFVEKFKPKKTTDDCYTPQNVFDAIANWVCKTYKKDPATIVRPFFPGGDYERYDYPEGCLVLDNPPFSILAEIVRFYEDEKIDFWLFSPYLTNFATGRNCCHFITGSCITYENGARVDTSFLTSLDDRAVVGCPELGRIIKEQDEINVKANTRQLPKYEYPSEVLTASMVGYMAKHGVAYEVKKKDALFIRGLDSQKTAGKSLFGGGFLLSKKATAEKLTAEKLTAEKLRGTKWELSARELDIIERLGR